VSARACLHWVAGAATAAAMLCAGAGSAVAAAAPGSPGPPPGAGTGFPSPPSPGAATTSTGGATAVAIPTTSTAPGLRSGVAQVSNDSVTLSVACSRGGSASLRDAGVKVSTTYKCRGGSAAPRFSFTHAQAGKLLAGGGSLATLTLAGSGGAPLSVQLSRATFTPTYWTSTFGLNCTAGGPDSALLSAPNFSVTPATTIDVRPWLAWYTPKTGWQWLGLQGADKSSWIRWTGTPSGVFEWQNGGVTTPWMWGPIQIAPGQSAQVVAVFEVIYWYSHPVYVWRYARSQPGSGASNCVYS
jgi:hypothetical protein